MIAERWIEQANQQPISEIARSLGLEVRRDRIGPCPACGERQERAVRRLCVGLVRGDRQWVCNRCGTGGDGVALVSWSTLGRATRGLEPEQWRALHAWFGDPRPAPQAAPVPPPPDYPPQAEVIALWGGSRRLTPDSPVTGWLSERRVDPARAVALDLVRESSHHSPAPLAAGERRVQAPGWPWVAALPLWDCAGGLRSLVFRAVQAPPDWLPRKSLAMRGYARAGLVFADPVALGLLRGGLSAAAPEDGGTGVRWDGKVFIVEGEPDFLTLATLPDRVSGGATSAVFGTVSATALLAAVGRRIPADAAVYLCPDQDEPGRRAMHRTRQEALSHVRQVFSIDIRSLR